MPVDRRPASRCLGSSETCRRRCGRSPEMTCGAKAVAMRRCPVTDRREGGELVRAPKAVAAANARREADRGQMGESHTQKASVR